MSIYFVYQHHLITFDCQRKADLIDNLNQSVTNIFEYSNIRIHWSKILIQTFVCINFSFTNIVGHSFVSNLFVQIYLDIRSCVLECLSREKITHQNHILSTFDT